MDHEVVTREQQWGEFEAKWAEAANTHVMPPEAKGRLAKASFPIKKSGSAEPPDDNLEDQVSEEQSAKNPQSAPLNPRVNIAGKEPPKVIKEKQAQFLALPSAGLYPLDSYAEVKTAAAYYDEWKDYLDPARRHEFCFNLVKRAEALDIEVSDEVQKYGSATYANPAEIEACLDARRTVLLDEDALSILDKLSVAQPTTEPEVFAGALEEFDKIAGIDAYYGPVPDAYYSTFGKQAEENKSWVIGNDVIYEKDVRRLGGTNPAPLLKMYGIDFVKEFKADPVGIFSSMPDDQKKIIGRLATQSNDELP